MIYYRGYNIVMNNNNGESNLYAKSEVCNNQPIFTTEWKDDKHFYANVALNEIKAEINKYMNTMTVVHDSPIPRYGSHMYCYGNLCVNFLKKINCTKINSKPFESLEIQNEHIIEYVESYEKKGDTICQKTHIYKRERIKETRIYGTLHNKHFVMQIEEESFFVKIYVNDSDEDLADEIAKIFGFYTMKEIAKKEAD